MIRGVSASHPSPQALGAERSKDALQRADTMQRAAGLLESMRGAARGVLPSTQAALFAQVRGKHGKNVDVKA